MIFFGHLGIGSALTRPIRKPGQRRWILLGCVLPDLIDKPIYYALSWSTGLHGRALGLICGTRTFGHTLLFLAVLCGLASIRRSRTLWGVALGVATHLFLDSLTDSGRGALLWPLTAFPEAPFHSLREHFLSWKRIRLVAAEIVGITLLVWETLSPGDPRRSRADPRRDAEGS